MNYYSDLAAENRELYPNKNEIPEEIFDYSGFRVGRIKIESEEEAKKINRPIGNYITVEAPMGFLSCDSEALARLLIGEIKNIIKKSPETVLFAGLGNRAITPDALGPKTAEKVIATRHISPSFAEKIGLEGLKTVAAISPGVLGQTGIETQETVKSAAEIVCPDLVVTVDALTARSAYRLGNTIQITDSGISPGSGVGNKRAEISEKTLSVPVISIGVPTVVNARGLVEELGLKTDFPDMIVTPKDIDSIIDSASRILALALNLFFQPHLDIDIIKNCM